MIEFYQSLPSLFLQKNFLQAFITSLYKDKDSFFGGFLLLRFKSSNFPSNIDKTDLGFLQNILRDKLFKYKLFILLFYFLFLFEKDFILFFLKFFNQKYYLRYCNVIWNGVDIKRKNLILFFHKSFLFKLLNN